LHLVTQNIRTLCAEFDIRQVSTPRTFTDVLLHTSRTHFCSPRHYFLSHFTSSIQQWCSRWITLSGSTNTFVPMTGCCTTVNHLAWVSAAKFNSFDVFSVSC